MRMSVRFISFQNKGTSLGAVERNLMPLSGWTPYQLVLTKVVPDALSHSTVTLLRCSFPFGDCLAIESQVCSLGVIPIPTSLLEMRGCSELASVGHTLMLFLRHLKSDQH